MNNSYRTALITTAWCVGGIAAGSGSRRGPASDGPGRTSQSHRPNHGGQRPPAHPVRPRGQGGERRRAEGYVQPAGALAGRQTRRRHQDGSRQGNQRLCGSSMWPPARAYKSRRAKGGRRRRRRRGRRTAARWLTSRCVRAASVYRKPSAGGGQEELLYQSPGAPMTLTDWSQDGRFLTYFSTDLTGGGPCTRCR